MARRKRKRKASLRELNGVETIEMDMDEMSMDDGMGDLGKIGRGKRGKKKATKTKRRFAGKVVVCQKGKGKKSTKMKCFVFPRKNYIMAVGKLPRTVRRKKKSS